MDKMKLLVGTIVVLLVASFGIPQKSQAQESKMITLAGYKMKPSVPTSGSGTATVKLKGDTLSVHGDFENLTNRFSGAYIMVDIRGEGGNQLFRLKADLNDEQTGGMFKEKKNRFGLSPAEKMLLKKGKLYITINTFEHQNGEIGSDIPKMGN
ncbi:CHRD domain-containing protein [Fodinibius saliphilus]|uniref:CHRD domain-containing protein n=1 Tax=Fodinibius saliphilus TaxID=1920650 RepID=UPI001109FE0A|nr:CHRD domain-containing protein [Fodinibius saliphilus]